MNYKITNGSILSFFDNAFKIIKEDIYIQDNKIAYIGSKPESDNSSYESIDASGKLIMPGLINMHTHVYMTILRNYADDVDFGEWLFNRVSPVEDRLPTEAAYWTNLLGFAEMFRSGTTSYVDMHMYKCMSGKAANACGIRAFIGRGLVGEDLYTDGYERFSQALAEQEEYGSDMIKIVLSPHAIYSASEKLYRQVAEEAQKRNLLKQTHLSEGLTELNDCLDKRGVTPVRFLNDIGFLDDKTILAHCVQLINDDVEILSSSGASVATNPASNAKLGNGFAPVADMEKAGVNICIGTDGTSSNNTLNMFREMGLLSLIHKGIQKDSTAMPAQTVLKAATVNAAKGLNMTGELGIISEGAYADLAFIDLKSPSLFPNNNIISSLCYSANGSEVDSLMINGKFVMKNKELLTIDYERVCYEVQKIADKYLFI